MPDHPREQLDDEALLGLLRSALEAGEPIPAGARDAAIDAYGFRDLDAALAELVEGSLSATRGSDGPLVFAAAELDAEITVDRSGTDAVGQLSPAGPWEGRVESLRHGRRSFRADELGRFRVPLAGGPVRIVVDLPGGAVRTDWFQR